MERRISFWRNTRISARLGELGEPLALVPDRLLVFRQARPFRAASGKASEIEGRPTDGRQEAE
ncbi:Zinc-binding dehydrogenase [Pseudozyma hubeiensis]|nr:Zinc-binding dehydrogenase [Pseudozyma hubeiensis]